MIRDQVPLSRAGRSFEVMSIFTKKRLQNKK